jgi:cell division protein FtsB
MESLFLVLTILLAGIVFYFYRANRKLAKENRVLHEIIEVKDTTISNLQASRVAVKDVIENLSAHDEVMQLIDAGESREAVSKKLDIPLSRVELIVKFDKIKKEQSR